MASIAIIGGTGALGKAIARRLAKVGQTVAIGSRKAESAQLTAQEPGGLAHGTNAAVADRRDVVMVPANLPQTSALDADLLAAAPRGTLSIAPDRHGTGTNALSLPLPDAKSCTFAFGTGSFARLCGEAQRLGLEVEIIRSPGLARDIDEPGDLPDAAAML